MISGAVYREGIARTTQGETYVYGTASGAALPAGTTGIPGSTIPGGERVDADGQLLVRFV